MTANNDMDKQNIGMTESYMAQRKKAQKNSKSSRTLKENFQQQTLPAWQPIITAGRISPALFIIGLLFVPSGVGIWLFSNSIKEVSISYTDCRNVLQPEEYPEDWNKSCKDVIHNSSIALVKTCKCRLLFNLTSSLEGPVYIYYALTNFYQNHRKYLGSRDDSQLRGDTGDAENPKKPAGACEPLDYEKVEGEKCVEDVKGQLMDNVTNVSEEKKNCRIYLPCGAIANSMFSDEIKLFRCLRNSEETELTNCTIQVPLNRTGISWKTDKDGKFENPGWFDDYHNSTALQNQFVKPPAWRKNLWELDPDNPENNGLDNEDLIVWMRVAALPNFRKLFRIVNQWDNIRREFQDGLPAGDYVLEIDYHFPVADFQGTKTIILSETSILGASNPFLGIAYVISGSVCLVLGFFLLCVHVKTRNFNAKVVHID